MGICPAYSKKDSQPGREGMGVFLRIRARLKGQRGAVSPFLFGLLAGVAIFSGTMKAKSELKLQQIKEAQVERERETAEQYKRAIEGAILSETDATYGTLDRARIEENLSKGIGGGTRSGERVAVGTIDTGARNEQRVIISTSDDKFVRDEVTGFSDATTAAESDLNKRGDIANVDTAALRTRQVQLTRNNLNKESEFVYAFWGANGRMPSSTEYENEINDKTGLTDFWGNDFTYTYINDDEATLEATTKWGQTLKVKMDMS